MNHLCYKTIFSKRLGTLVAVGEHACSQSKGQGASAAPGAAGFFDARFVGTLALGFASVSLGWSQTLPQGAQVVQGVVSVSQSGHQMAITQSTPKAVVNWQSFDIGQNAKVNVLQPSSQSVLLNRVLSDNPTQILGQLQANGQVVLVNPKGIVVGSDGSVSASAFTASTLNISDADFMAGNMRYTRDGSTGQVINKGRIEVAPGGYVALLGAGVSNEGQIIAPQGGVALGAADTVTVPLGRTGKIKLELTPASINAAVANQKDGVIVAEGGQNPLFVDGQPSDYTNMAMEFCNNFEQERQRTEGFVALVKDLDLLDIREAHFTPRNPDGTPGQPQKLAEYYAVSEDKLRALPAEKLVELRDNGALGQIYAHLVSLLGWDRLIALTFQRNAAQPAAANA